MLLLLLSHNTYYESLLFVLGHRRICTTKDIRASCTGYYGQYNFGTTDNGQTFFLFLLVFSLCIRHRHFQCQFRTSFCSLFVRTSVNKILWWFNGSNSALVGCKVFHKFAYRNFHPGSFSLHGHGWLQQQQQQHHCAQSQVVDVKLLNELLII